MDEVGQSICWAIRSDGLIAFVPQDSPFPRPGQEPCLDSPVPDAIGVAERSRAGTEEQIMTTPTSAQIGGSRT